MLFIILYSIYRNLLYPFYIISGMGTYEKQKIILYNILYVSHFFIGLYIDLDNKYFSYLLKKTTGLMFQI